ncbi:MAG: hypothetical protein R3A13_06780 [Bdellovibrionota bacterium]
MDPRFVIGLLALVGAAISGGIILYYLLAPKSKNNIQSLMGRETTSGFKPGSGRQKLDDAEIEKAKNLAKKTALAKEEVHTLEERFFMAGLFSKEDQKYHYFHIQKIGACICAPIAIYALADMGALMALLGGVFGAVAGWRVPATFLLDSRIRKRSEDILYYLPLVIEQIAIGVSSSLDIGPCLQRVVQMADERDTHNSVTELLRYSQSHVRSGVSLEQSLLEIGKMSGHTELKHAFMSLGQVAKHGGEITRQFPGIG